MLKVYLCTTSFPPLSLLPRISAVVTPYYIWPRPYSDAARELLEVAAVEYKSPGTALRTTLMEENPALVPGFPSSSSTASDSMAIPKERNAWILFDKDRIGARILYDILKQHIPTQTPTVELQLRFMSTVFHTVLKVKPDNLGLEYATNDQIGLYYGAAITILEHSLTIPDAQSVAYYTAELSALQKKILSEIGSAIHHKPAKPLRFPPLNFLTKSVPFQVSDVVVDTGAHTRHRFPKRESYEYLTEILTQAQELVVPGEQPPIVKIGIVGGDDTIHNLATGFIMASSVHPELVESLDLRFYYIPVADSDLGNWIYSLDPWYGRQAIVLPRTVIGLYPNPDCGNNNTNSPFASASSSSPFMSSSSATSTSNPSGRSMSVRLDAGALGAGFIDLIEEQTKMVSPSTIFHNELEHMFREAKYQLKVNLFRAECVMPDNSSLTIPFYSRASLGLTAAIEAFKKINDLGTALAESEIVAHKNFKWNPPTIAMKYIQMNPLNVARAIGQQDARVYTSVTLAALPTPSDAANFVHPDPTQPWLELALMEDKKKKTNAREEVRTYHVSQVELTGPEPFDLCLDGIYYGQISKVKFTAATYADKDAIYSMPFMTFFPTDGLH